MTASVIQLLMVALLGGPEGRGTRQDVAMGPNHGAAEHENACRIESTLCTEFLQSDSSRQLTQVLEHLRVRISERPGDADARTLEILALSRTGEVSAARDEMKLLVNDRPACATLLKDEIGDQVRLLESKTEFIAALHARDPVILRSAIDDSELSEADKFVLRVYADVYSADFDVAMKRLKARRTDIPAEEHARLTQKVTDLRRAYQTYERWMAFLAWSSRGHNHGFLTREGPYVPDGMSPDASTLSALDLRAIAAARLRAFLEAAFELQNIAPLDDLSVTSFFLASLLFEPYEDFEARVDELLGYRSVAKIPFDTEAGSVGLEIDTATKRLRTVPEALPRFKDFAVDDWIPKGENFDLQFDEIEKLSQRVDFLRGVTNPYTRKEFDVRMPHRTVFLEVEPRGRLGTLSFFSDYTKTFGERASKRVMHNFGSYILHLIANDKVSKRSRLVEDSKSGGTLLTLARVFTDGGVESSDAYEQEVFDEYKERDHEMAAWESRLTQRAFETVETRFSTAMHERLMCGP